MTFRKKNSVPAFFAPALCLLLAACSGPIFSVFPRDAKDDPTRRFVLSSEVRNLDESATFPRVAFSRISVPSYLDVPQIVTRRGNEISRSEKNLWGEPLARGAARVLELRCSAALAGTLNAADGKIVRCAIERLDGETDGNVEIAAAYAVLPKTSAAENAAEPEARLFRASVKVEAPNDFSAYVKALDAALNLLARDIAAQLGK